MASYNGLPEERYCNILREYYNSPREDDKEAQKRAILLTAAKLIKTFIKTTLAQTEDTYETTAELKLAAALDFIQEWTTTVQVSVYLL